MGRNKIQVKEPKGGYLTIDYSKKTGKILDVEIDWKGFLGQSRGEQASLLKDLMGEIERRPAERKDEFKAWLKEANNRRQK